MEKARVAIFEDSELLQDNLALLLKCENHQVVAQATTMQAAETVIHELSEDALDIAIVDGNLSPRALGCEEGAHITRLLHEKFSAITVISYSGEKDIEGADIQFGKLNGFLELLAVIKEV